MKTIIFVATALFSGTLVLAGAPKPRPVGDLKSQPVTGAPIIKNLSVAESAALIKKNASNKNFVILDVRTAQEYQAAHLAKAINLDFYSSEFKNQLKALDQKKNYLVHCAAGSRSSKALAIMKELDFKAVYNMLGGFNGWKDAGFPFMKG